MATEEQKLKQLKRRIRKMVNDYPDLVTDALVEQPFWHQALSSKEFYRRYSDDNNSVLSVCFSEDGDGWVEAISFRDPKELFGSHRFRTYFGGGQSLRTRTALLVLARAIALDCEERPQHRPIDSSKPV